MPRMDAPTSRIKVVNLIDFVGPQKKITKSSLFMSLILHALACG